MQDHPMRRRRHAPAWLERLGGCALAVFVALVASCGSDENPPSAASPREESCAAPSGLDAGLDLAPDGGAAATGVDLLQRIGCRSDFDQLASEPLDSSLPGARSVKVVLDQADHDTLYFQNSRKFPIHFAFASRYLSGGGRPLVPPLSEFNQTEYFSADRRFVLGAVTYYEGPKAWVLEIAPYDTASVAMVTKLFKAVSGSVYFRGALTFHPTSQVLETSAKSLPSSIRVTTTDTLYAAIDYQPLNLASAVGRLRFVKATDLATTYLSFRDIVVLDRVPNDISVVLGLVTEEFQTPLSHVNVLSQNRHTPNMGLRAAMTNPVLRALEGQWVRLTVGAFAWSVSAASADEAEAFWQNHKPQPVTLRTVDPALPAVLDLRDLTGVTVEAPGVTLRDAIVAAVPAFGGKAAHLSVLANTPGLPIPKAFVIPAAHYTRFMQQNGLFDRVDALLADASFRDQPDVRNARLADLRQAIMTSPVDPDLQAALKAKLAADFPGRTVRFRTSTNSEDLDGFPCAGCYESHTGDPSDWNDVLNAVREAWSSIWLFRTFEERSYNGIDHKAVVMALLVHPNFPNESANGVATTANPFDPSGLQPGFYVNVQHGGDAEVVHPPPGVVSDQFIVQFSQPGQPVTFLSHSNLIPKGEQVLSPLQIYDLGTALDAIHTRFSAAYGPAAGRTGWYAMDVEFKFDGQPPQLVVKQARPYPGRGQ